MRLHQKTTLLLGTLLVLLKADLLNAGTCNKTGYEVQIFAFCCCRQITVLVSSTTAYQATTINVTASSTIGFQASALKVTPTPTSSSIFANAISPTTSSNITISSTISINGSFNASIGNISITPSSSVSSFNVSSSVIISSINVPVCFQKALNARSYNQCYCWTTQQTFVRYNGSHSVPYNGTTPSDLYKCWNITKPKPKLYIGGLFDLNSKSGWSTLPAAEMAIEEINNRTDTLDAYELVLLANTSTKVSKILMIRNEHKLPVSTKCRPQGVLAIFV